MNRTSNHRIRVLMLLRWILYYQIIVVYFVVESYTIIIPSSLSSSIQRGGRSLTFVQHESYNQNNIRPYYLKQAQTQARPSIIVASSSLSIDKEKELDGSNDDQNTNNTNNTNNEIVGSSDNNRNNPFFGTTTNNNNNNDANGVYDETETTGNEKDSKLNGLVTMKDDIDNESTIVSTTDEDSSNTDETTTDPNNNNNNIFVVDKQTQQDIDYMKLAIDLALENGGELGIQSAYPNPTFGAVLVSYDETTNEPYILGKGRSDYRMDAIRGCLGSIPDIEIAPFQEWAVSWPLNNNNNNAQIRRAIQLSTLYITLEPSCRRYGTAVPPITSLLRQIGIGRIVIGCLDPVPENTMKGATILHNAGIQVVTNLLQDYQVIDPSVLELCQSTIAEYTERSNSKLQRMARKHYEQFHRPLGFLHCSVVASDDIEAFARHGNAFGVKQGNNVLNFRNRGAYELAPPPDVIWADENANNYEIDDSSNNGLYEIDFEDESYQGDMLTGNPMMPWYEQVDAVVATFPRQGNGPPDDDSITARLNGLKWLATHGNELPAGVERILVMDATDLPDLPLTNTDVNLPNHVDIEAFWRADGRKPTRILLRRGLNDLARAAAVAAAEAAVAASKAAQEAAAAIESGDAEAAAQAALECRKTAEKSAAFIQQELVKTQSLRRILEDQYGVVVETIEGGEPLDIMKHLGERNGMYSVVWRAGCWGQRGVQAVMAGAFQWISAHLAVDAVGGRFWQLMIAENAIQAACGPESKVKIFADQHDISMEYCDEPEVDKDCTLTFEGRPVRHVRVDCRVGLIDTNRKREFSIAKTTQLTKQILTEEAPWFL